MRLATSFGRYGYRQVTALLLAGGWTVNHKRAGAHLAAGEAPRVPRRQPKTGPSVADRPLPDPAAPYLP